VFAAPAHQPEPRPRWRADPAAAGGDWAGPLTHVLSALAFASRDRGRGAIRAVRAALWHEGERRSGLALLAVMIRAAAGPRRSSTCAARSGRPIRSRGGAHGRRARARLDAARYSLLKPPPLGHRQVIEHLRHAC